MPAESADRTAQGWSGVASGYDRQVFPFTSRYAADALAAVAPRAGARILDVAAGSGALTVLAARAGASVTAIDFAAEMLKILDKRLAAEKLPNVVVRQMDGQALTFLDARFDAVFSVFGLIFFPDRAKGLREMKRVLKPGGKVAIVSWQSAENAAFITLLREGAHRAGIELPPPSAPLPIFSLADPDQLRAELTATGFRDVRVTALHHTWNVPTPEDYFASADGTSPVFAPMLAAIGDENLPRVKVALAELIRERYGAGPVRIPAAAWLGVGVA